MKNLTLLLALGAGYLVYKSKTPGKTTNSEAKKLYYLDKDCRLVITNREQSLKWAYNQGKNFKKVDDDFKKLLFGNCAKNEIKLDTKESIIFFYDLFTSLFCGLANGNNLIVSLIYVRIWNLYFQMIALLNKLKINNTNELKKPVNFSIFEKLLNNRGYTINNCELIINDEFKFINFCKDISAQITDFLDKDDDTENELNFYLAVITDFCGQFKLNNDKVDYLLTYAFLKGQLENGEITKEIAQKGLADTLADFNKDNIDTSNWPKDI